MPNKEVIILVQFIQRHETMCLPEFISNVEAACSTADSNMISQRNCICDQLSKFSNEDANFPLILLRLSAGEAETSINLLIKATRRSLLVKHLVHLWVNEISNNYTELHSRLRINCNQYIQNLERRHDNCTFSIMMHSINKRRDGEYHIKRIEELLYFPKIDINLSNPSCVLCFIERHGEKQLTDNPKEIYFGQILAEGARDIPTRFDIKKRLYIGNTTMDPQLAAIMCTMAKVKQDSLVLDPFCGTGGILIAAANLGAECIGTEIDYNTVFATGKTSRVGGSKMRGIDESIRANFRQYGLEDRLQCIILSDSTSLVDMCNSNILGLIDVIVTDPPYGLREKGAKVGYRPRPHHWLPKPVPTKPHNHFPQKCHYSQINVYTDLVDLSVKLLRPCGRLAYWFPCIYESYCGASIPKHDSMRLIANCLQPLAANYGRRLIVMEKCADPSIHSKAQIDSDMFIRRFRDVVLRDGDIKKN